MERPWSEVIDEVGWAKLSHAYGPATDTPAHLRAFVGGSAEGRKAASHHLLSAIMHQGTPWSATPAVARVITGLLRDSTIIDLIRPSREGMIAFLLEVEDCLRELSRDDWLKAEQMAAAVPDGFEDIGDWDAVERSVELVDGYFAYAGLHLRRIAPGIRACLESYGR